MKNRDNSIMKSQAKSDSLRKIGNQLYSDRKFNEALLKYNQSLCYAEKSSESLGNAYANRSAVFFEIKQFKHAIDNILLAIANGYPEKNVNILKTREQKCIEQIKIQRKSNSSREADFFKLSYKSCSKDLSVVDCLEARTNDKFGRYVITKQPLRIGDVIAVDTPFASVLLSQSKFFDVSEDNIYSRCSNCFAVNDLNLMPCDLCCHGES